MTPSSSPIAYLPLNTCLYRRHTPASDFVRIGSGSTGYPRKRPAGAVLNHLKSLGRSSRFLCCALAHSVLRFHIINHNLVRKDGSPLRTPAPVHPARPGQAEGPTPPRPLDSSGAVATVVVRTLSLRRRRRRRRRRPSVRPTTHSHLGHMPSRAAHAVCSSRPAVS